jgi:DNA-binding MarR family transcriptional regulator
MLGDLRGVSGKFSFPSLAAPDSSPTRTASDKSDMLLEPLVVSPARLRILTALAAEPRQAFVELRRRTGLTDGNLTTHARRLAAAGLIAIDKSIRDGKPLTRLELTIAGRCALEAHARHLLAVLDRVPTPPPEAAKPAASDALAETNADDDWVD